MYVVNRDLARRLEAAEAAHWGSLAKGLPAHYGAEVKQFGTATALVCPGMARRSFVNRVMLAETGEDLGAALRYFREKGLPCRVDATPFAGGEILAYLERESFHQRGFQTALYFDGAPDATQECEIRLADLPEWQQFAAAALPAAFGEQAETWIQWLTDSIRATFGRPDWRTYIAFVQGQPAAFAQLHIEGRAGCLALAGTLPAFRGHGAQTALIQRRIADALAAGCDLICTQTGPGTVSQHNMERAGFRIAYTKAEFYGG